MIVARYHTQTRVDEKLSGPVGVDQADELVTTSPGVGRLLLLCEFLAADRIVVLIKEKPHGTFVGGIVGNKQIGSVSNKDSFRIEGVMLFKDSRNVAVEPLLQGIRIGLPRHLAQIILIARCLAVVIVLVVETLAAERNVSGIRVHRL